MHVEISSYWFLVNMGVILLVYNLCSVVKIFQTPTNNHSFIDPLEKWAMKWKSVLKIHVALPSLFSLNFQQQKQGNMHKWCRVSSDWYIDFQFMVTKILPNFSATLRNNSHRFFFLIYESLEIGVTGCLCY